MSESERMSRPPDKDYGSAIAQCLGTNRKHKGTGFLVGLDYILTCAHVVRQCLGITKKTDDVSTIEVTGKMMEIVFLADPKSFLTVEVVPELWRFGGEDMAVLKLSQAVPDSVSILSLLSLKQGQEFWHHQFQVFGFPENRSDGRWATGEMLGALPESRRVQLEGTKNEGLGIQEGFSGSPVWDETLGGVVGMTVSRDEDESTKIGFMIPYERLKPVLEAIALFDILLPEQAKLTPHWKNAYQLIEPANIHETYPKTIQEAILKVLDMPDRQGYRAIALFVGYFALQALGLNIPKIRTWLEQQNINVSELLQNIGQRLPQTSQQQGSPHLLFCVETDHNSDRFNVSAYLIKNSNNPEEQIQIKAPEEILLQSPENKASFAQLEEILQNCLEECVEQIGSSNNPENMRVEIFLPLDKLKLKEVYHWTASAKSEYDPYPQPVACRYQQVLRLSERLNPLIYKPQMRDSWTKKWDALQQIRCQSPCTGFVSEMDTDGKLRTIKDLLIELRKKESTGLILHRMLSSITEDNPLPILLGTGIPIAIWLDPDCFNKNDILSACPQDLPNTVQSKHEAAYNAVECGANIGLVWEDPHLIPFVAQSKYKMAGN